MSSQNFIEMRNIVKTFKTSAGEFTALKGVNADFRRGEFVGVVGKSGSGKSTLVNMLTGIDHPTSGQVKIGDTYVHKLNESKMARWRGRNLGIVFQFYQLLPMLSLLENVMLPMDFGEMYTPTERERRALDLLDRVGLADLAHKMPAQVSGGQQQSAAVARALANDPPLIVADEPTGNLDSKSADTVFHIFEELAAQSKTIVMVTHDNSLAGRAQRKMVLADGEVIDEAIVSTLPLLSHRQMLRATKAAKRQRFQPGETIIQQGQEHDHLYIIANGAAEVYLGDGRAGVVAELGPGQFFGEMELLQRRSGAVATIKAAINSAVEVLALEGYVFGELMNEAQAMREVMIQTVQQRLAQNVQFLNKRQPVYA
ncbi:MAG: ATP-binding cassette domain-containing protein [Anaerolineae bacterium]|nr:ATP-binding cassette domain-containing protein [Anaerolineae bacterium]